MNHELAEESKDLAYFGQRIAALTERKNMRELRQDQLREMVGSARTRIARQPKSKEFLEKLQEISHKKSVGLFEELLSAVVQDVLPGEKNVALTLKTARGVPALEIEMVKAGGQRESILEGSGGALTNIISAGLRIIALSRSGAYPFLVLDEPDCWLKPSRVPQFANVLGQIAEDLQIQVLLISHHEADFFSRFSSQVKLEVRGGALQAQWASEPDPNAWAGASSGIKELRLVNYMSHAQTVIPLCPGVTCLTGENDIGKSAIVSALRDLFYGKSKDSAIAHGSSQFRVEAQFFDDSVLSLERYAKSSPKQRWRYCIQGQTEPIQDSSPKDGAPEWVEHVANMARTEDLDIAFANQKSPVFLLDETPSRQASILAVGRESAHLQRLMAKNNERNLMDARIVKDGESEGAAIARELAEMSKLDEFDDRLNGLRRELSSIEASGKALAAWQEKARRLSALSAAMASAKAMESAIALARPRLSATSGLSAGIGRLARAAAAASLSLDCEAAARPALREMGALFRAVPALRKALSISALDAPSSTSAAPRIAPTNDLSKNLGLLGRAQRRACLSIGGRAPQAPSLAAIGDANRWLARLKKLRQAENALASAAEPMAAPKAPLLTRTEKLEEALSLAKSVGERLVKFERYSVIGQSKDDNLNARVAQLVKDVGGACPTCSAPLDEKHLRKGGRHD